MTGRVIQGFFIGGRPRIPSPVAQPHLPGPPAPAFAERPPVVQPHGAGDAFSVGPRRLGLASGGGLPPPEAVRGKIEAALGADFSNRRVHVGPPAERIGAIAFTVGSDIYFAPAVISPTPCRASNCWATNRRMSFKIISLPGFGRLSCRGAEVAL